MSRRIVIQCEGCDKQYGIPTSMGEREWENLNNGWLTLKNGNWQEIPDQHFCSVDCLRKHLGMGEVTQSLEQSQSKMRRFVLVNGETADETEGVKWSDGRVTLESRGCSLERWEDFKSANPGCGVTWIDQEIKEEEMSHAAD